MEWRRVPWELRYRHGARLASEWRRLLVTATHRHCRVEFNGPVRVGPGFALDIPDGGSFVVGHGVDFRRGFVCEISGAGRVTIGGGSIFTRDVTIQCTTSVDIGEHCVFAAGVLVADGSHRFREGDRPMLDQGYDYRPITIGRGAAVMTNSTVVASIGERSFVGANSLVNRDMPSDSLIGGVPARVLDTYG
jgi:acetyltransferase-like isoleucine patch superfamily enzyme